jgi:hypothetical protein
LRFYNIYNKKYILHTEYDDLGLALKDLTINTRKHSHKRYYTFDRLKGLLD